MLLAEQGEMGLRDVFLVVRYLLDPSNYNDEASKFGLNLLGICECRQLCKRTKSNTFLQAKVWNNQETLTAICLCELHLHVFHKVAHCVTNQSYQHTCKSITNHKTSDYQIGSKISDLARVNEKYLITSLELVQFLVAKIKN